MSLRARLTLFYTSILGSVLILFGVAVYLSISLVLIRQVDRNLENVTNDLLQIVEIDRMGDFRLTSQFSFNAGMVIQAWDTKGTLMVSTQSFSPLSSLVFPLDTESLSTNESVFREVMIGDTHLRVLSFPLIGEQERLGTLQAGTDLGAVDDVRRELLQLLVGMGLVALSMAAVAGWFSTRRALAPLATMTETALQITKADDLQRRIRHHGSQDDEVGKLIEAFNQTLSQMERLFETQRRFVADVGHELRTPLTVMKGNLDLMRRMKDWDEQSVHSIESEVNRLTRLVEDLLLLAQAESGKMPLTRNVVELDTVLLEIYQQAKVLAGEEINIRIGDIDQVLVCGDRDRLKQVLLNLSANAVHHTPANGEIVLSLRKSGQWANLTVRDSGPGIGAKDLPHIFERFYRGEKSRPRSKDGKGFGLGLSIAYWIVKNHHGRIEVDSKNGAGTTFSLWLPMADGECEDTLPVITPDADELVRTS